jgi:hypothetical protein
MQAKIRENTATKESWSVIHPLSPEDSAAMTALRSAVAGMKGKLEGTSARVPFNGIMEHVATPDGVSRCPGRLRELRNPHLLRCSYKIHCPTRLIPTDSWWFTIRGYNWHTE